MTGLILKTTLSFGEIVNPIIDWADSLHWLIQVAQGEINYLGTLDREELYESLYIDFEDRMIIYKPGFIREFSAYIKRDEGAYYIGYPANSTEEVIKKGTLLDKKIYHFDFFETLQLLNGLLFYQKDTDLAVFSSHKTILDRLKEISITSIDSTEIDKDWM